MSRRIILPAAAVLAAASACPLHDLAEALERGALAAGPHEWPYAAACAAYANASEETWCAAGVRNSSGLAALNAWSGGGYGAYRVAEECGAPLPRCFVEADRETTAIKLTKLIDWGPEYEDDTARWDREIEAICHEEIEYWQPHIGAYIGRNEFIEYAYTLSPKFNGESFLHSPIRIVDLAKGEGDWVMTYTWRTAAGFAGETLDGKPEETTILKLGFAETIGEEYKLTYTEFSRPTYEFMSRISMAPETLCTGALAYCPGSLFPYTSRRECVDYLSYRVADRCLDGGGGFFAGDTRACRQMHLQLALLDPVWKSNFRAPRFPSLVDFHTGWTRSATVRTWDPIQKSAPQKRDREDESRPSAIAWRRHTAVTQRNTGPSLLRSERHSPSRPRWRCCS